MNNELSIDEVQAGLILAQQKLNADIQASEKYNELYESYNHKRTEALIMRDNLKFTGDYLTDIYNAVKEHEIERQREAYAMFNEAIKNVGNLVSDASMATMSLEKDDSGKVAVIDNLGNDVNIREGGAARTCTGLSLRYIALVQDFSALKMMYLDEGLFAIDAENMQAVKKSLQEMSKDCLIIITEQHRFVTEGIADKTYIFEKNGDYTQVIEKVNEVANG